jgi:hypothetical protein
MKFKFTATLFPILVNVFIYCDIELAPVQNGAWAYSYTKHTTECSPLKVNWCCGGTYSLCFQGWRMSWGRNQWPWLPPAFNLVSCSPISSTLTMKVTCSSKTFNTLHGITSYSHQCESLKPYRMHKCNEEVPTILKETAQKVCSSFLFAELLMFTSS